MTPLIRSILQRCAAALCLALAAPASASIYTITYSGTVISGYDQTGRFFGDDDLPHDLAGLAYRSVYTVDTGLGQTMLSATDIVVTGGSILGLTNPILSASMTINGASNVFASDIVSQDLREINPLLPRFGTSTIAWRYDPVSLEEQYLFHSVQSQSNGFPLLLELDAAFAYDLGVGDQYEGSFKFDAPGLSAAGQLNVMHVEVSRVPEPATAALMALGLALGLR